MAVTTLLPDANLEIYDFVVPNGNHSGGSSDWTGTYADIDDGLTPNDADFLVSDTTHPNTHQLDLTTVDMGASGKIVSGRIFGRIKQSGWSNDTFSVTITIVIGTNNFSAFSGTPTSFTDYSTTWLNPNSASNIQSALDSAFVQIQSAQTVSMGADTITAYCSNVFYEFYYSPVPKEIGLVAVSGSSVDFSRINSDNASYLTPQVNAGTALLQGYGLSNTASDFTTADSATFKIRAFASVASVCSMDVKVMSGGQAGTVLAALNSSGLGQDIGAFLGVSESEYITSFDYINTSATKTEWDDAVIIIGFSNNDSVARTISLELASIDVTYTVASSTSFIIPRKDRLMGTYLQL